MEMRLERYMVLKVVMWGVIWVFYFFICQLLFMLFLLCFSYLFSVCLDFYVFFFFSFLDQGTVKTTKEGRVVVG